MHRLSVLGMGHFLLLTGVNRFAISLFNLIPKSLWILRIVSYQKVTRSAISESRV